MNMEKIMKSICRHIKSDGGRCHCYAMLHSPFCYFHDRGHAATRIQVQDNLYLPPVIDSPAAVQIAISQTLHAMLCSRINSKQTGHLLYGIATAAAALRRPAEPADNPVQSVFESEEGEQFAPQLCLDDDGREQECPTCPNHDTCDILKLEEPKPAQVAPTSEAAPRPDLAPSSCTIGAPRSGAVVAPVSRPAVTSTSETPPETQVPPASGPAVAWASRPAHPEQSTSGAPTASPLEEPQTETRSTQLPPEPTRNLSNLTILTPRPQLKRTPAPKLRLHTGSKNKKLDLKTPEGIQRLLDHFGASPLTYMYLGLTPPSDRNSAPPASDS
jgi:hypothetical protein